MRQGTVRLRGWNAMSVTAVFEPGPGAGRKTHVLSPSWFLGRRRRRASHCVRCDAVVLAPDVAGKEPGPAFPRYGESDTDVSRNPS